MYVHVGVCACVCIGLHITGSARVGHAMMLLVHCTNSILFCSCIFLPTSLHVWMCVAAMAMWYWYQLCLITLVWPYFHCRCMPAKAALEMGDFFGVSRAMDSFKGRQKTD